MITRINDAATYGLAKFKECFLQFITDADMTRKPARFQSYIKIKIGILEGRAARNAEIAREQEARAEAPRGLIERMLG